MGVALFDEAETQQILAEYLAGASILWLSQKHYCSDGTIRKLIKRAGHVLPRGHRWGHPHKTRQAVAHDYAAGMKPRQITRKHGVPYTSILRYARAFGVAINHASQAKLDNVRAQVVEEYAAGLSTGDIAAKLGLAQSTACRILHQENVQLRGRWGNGTGTKPAGKM